MQCIHWMASAAGRIANQNRQIYTVGKVSTWVDLLLSASVSTSMFSGPAYYSWKLKLGVVHMILMFEAC